MTSDRSTLANPGHFVHVIAEDHRIRAGIAMAVTEIGGHAETYENIAEIVAAKPKAGTALVSSELGSATQILAQFQLGDVILPLIMFAKDPNPSQIVKAVHQGAADYLAWPFSGEELLSSCAYCQTFMEEEGSRIIRQRQAQHLVESLSRRERQILALMVDGHSNKSMASVLNLSLRTVEDYRLNTMKKLGVQASSSAIRVGLEAGLQSQRTASVPQPAAINSQSS